MTGFVSHSGQEPQPASSGGDGLGRPGSAIGGMLSQQSIAATKASVQQLVDSAKSGGFAISEAGGDEYIRVFREFEDSLADLQFQLDGAKQAPQLGTSPYAQQTAAHMQLMATGDDQSFETTLLALKEIVQKAREAFEEAKKKYAAMEDEAVQTFHGAQS